MEKIGVLGTGMVGQAIGNKLVSLGYDVMLGSRSAANTIAAKWREGKGALASAGTFADAARHGEMVFVCVKGEAALEGLRLADPANMKGKVVIDVSNPLDFSKGMPPSLLPDLMNPDLMNTNSLGEEVQKLLHNTHVVKTLNIVNCDVMVNPSLAGVSPTMFMCGNDAGAKESVRALLTEFGWTRYS